MKTLSTTNRKKISNTLLKYYETHSSPFKGKKMTDSQKLKISQSRIGKKMSEITREKMKSTWSKFGQYGKIAPIRSKERIHAEIADLELQGFRCIPITHVVPDIIAIRDGKVYAIEVEYGKPNYQKYTETIRQYYDDVIWILIKRK